MSDAKYLSDCIRAMTNPFDLRTVLFAKHAQHVVLIHFPIALFITGVGLDLVSRVKHQAQLASAAYLNVSIAALTAIPAAVSGVLAWQFALCGKRLKGVLLLHVVAASFATLLVITCWWLHWRSRRSTQPVLSSVRIAVELIAAAAVALTAHLGGFLSGVNP